VRSLVCAVVTMGSNAQATTKGAIILLTNFVFISVIFPFVVLAFLDFSSLRTQFWPFTQVLRKNWPRVTRKVGQTADDTDRFLDWRLTQTPYSWTPVWARRIRQPPELPTRFLSVLSAQSVVNFIGAGFTAAFPHRVFGKRDRRATDPRSDRALKGPA
jgi:hypothetical protein